LPPLAQHEDADDPTALQNAGRQPMREEAYDRLKDAIQRLELEPGSVMSDSELARRLGMSRTPVREALALLEKDLLVARVPNRGVVIRSLTIDEVIHVMQMREALDGMAARLAAAHISLEVLDDLKRDFEEMMRTSATSSDQHSALSKRLHIEIMRAAGNPFLESASNSLMSSFERTRQHSWRIWNAARDSERIAKRRYDEHMEIIEALRQRDPRRAEKAARKHVMTGLQDILKAMTQRG
jgi:DNA-binding GntR family transcriptional regulator